MVQYMGNKAWLCWIKEDMLITKDKNESNTMLDSAVLPSVEC